VRGSRITGSTARSRYVRVVDVLRGQTRRDRRGRVEPGKEAFAVHRLVARVGRRGHEVSGSATFAVWWIGRPAIMRAPSIGATSMCRGLLAAAPSEDMAEPSHGGLTHASRGEERDQRGLLGDLRGARVVTGSPVRLAIPTAAGGRRYRGAAGARAIKPRLRRSWPFRAQSDPELGHTSPRRSAATSCVPEIHLPARSTQLVIGCIEPFVELRAIRVVEVLGERELGETRECSAHLIRIELAPLREHREGRAALEMAEQAEHQVTAHHHPWWNTSR
jgi:hypothetical protein